MLRGLKNLLIIMTIFAVISLSINDIKKNIHWARQTKAMNTYSQNVIPITGDWQTIEGHIVSINEGDELYIEIQGKGRVQVRLASINAYPRIWNKNASWNEVLKITGMNKGTAYITVRFKDQDKYARLLGYVYCKNTNKDLNLEMVRSGCALFDRKWVEDRKLNDNFRAAENEAKSAKRGYWQNPSQPAPKEVKKKNIVRN